MSFSRDGTCGNCGTPRFGQIDTAASIVKAAVPVVGSIVGSLFGGGGKTVPPPGSLPGLIRVAQEGQAFTLKGSATVTYRGAQSGQDTRKLGAGEWACNHRNPIPSDNYPAAMGSPFSDPSRGQVKACYVPESEGSAISRITPASDTNARSSIQIPFTWSTGTGGTGISLVPTQPGTTAPVVIATPGTVTPTSYTLPSYSVPGASAQPATATQPVLAAGIGGVSTTTLLMGLAGLGLYLAFGRKGRR